MPIFEVKAPNGKVLEIQSDEMPNEEQLKKVYGEMFPPESGQYTKTALGVGAGVLQEAAPTIAKTAGVATELLVPGYAGVDESGLPPSEEMFKAEQKLKNRSLVETIKAIPENPLYKAGETAKKYWEETIPRTQEEKESLMGRGGEQAGAMLPYFLMGQGGTAYIGAESYAKHLVDDFENLKQNFGEEEAANIAAQRAALSGVLQMAVFKYLPPILRQAGERAIMKRVGDRAITRFIGGRVAHAAETGALMSAAAVPENLVSGRPATEGIGAAGIGGVILGAATKRTPARIRQEEPNYHPVSDETMGKVEQALTKEGRDTGFKWDIVDNEVLDPENPLKVMHTLSDGSVVVSRPRLRQALEEHFLPGVDPNEVIKSMVTEEQLHGFVQTFRDAQGKTGAAFAKDFWSDFTWAEKKLLGRVILGRMPEKLSDRQAYKRRFQNAQDMGHEAVRLFLQRAGGMTPAEFISVSRRDAITAKTLTRLAEFVGWLRKGFETKANARQRDFLDKVTANIEGARNAISQPSATGVSEREVRTSVGQEAPLRQQGEATPAQEAGAETVGQQAQVSLGEKVAKEVGGTYRGTNQGYDLYEVQHPDPIGRQLIRVPEGSPVEAVRAKMEEHAKRFTEAEAKPVQEIPPVKATPDKGTPDTGIKFGRQAPMAGEQIERAAYVADDGTIHSAPNHPEALKKAGVGGFETRESRNTPRFGYVTNKRHFVSRELAEKIIKRSGQKLEEFETPGKPHSDEIQAPGQPAGTKLGDVKEVKPPPAAEPAKAKAKKPPAAEAAKPKKTKAPTMKDVAKAELEVKARLMKGAVEDAQGTLDAEKEHWEKQFLDPDFTDELRDRIVRRLKFIQDQIDFVKKQKVPPTAQPGEAPPAAPAKGKAKPGVAAPVEPAISTPTTQTSKPQEVTQARAELDAFMRDINAQVRGGGRMTTEQVQKLKELRKRAGSPFSPGLTLKSRSRLTEELRDIDRVVAMGPQEFMEKINAAGIPQPTKAAYELANTINTTERYHQIAEAGKVVDEQGNVAMEAGKFNEALALSAKRQFFTEALRLHDARNAVVQDRMDIEDAAQKHGVELRDLQEVLGRELRESPGMSLKEKPKKFTEEEVRAIVARIIPEGEFEGTLKQDRDKTINELGQWVATLEPDKQIEAIRKIYDQTEEQRAKLAQEQMLKRMPFEMDPLKMREYRKSLSMYLNEEAKQLDIKVKGSKATEGQRKLGLLQPADKGPKVRYAFPEFNKWASRVIDPILNPEVTRDHLRLIWDEMYPEFLNNASKEKIEELRKAAHLDFGRFRGYIPDPDLEPILRGMLKAPKGTLTPEFIKLAASKGMSKEQAMKFLLDEKAKMDEVYRGMQLQEPSAEEAARPKNPTTEEIQKMIESGELKKGSIILKQSQGRELTNREKGILLDEFRKARQIAFKRREGLIAELHRLGMKGVRTEAKSPMRTKIGIDDIAFTNRDSKLGAYYEFTSRESEDESALKTVLDDESAGTAKQSKRVTLLVNKDTKNVEAVSTYRHYRTGEIMLYDPRGTPGDQTRGYFRLNQILPFYQIKGSILLEHPVHNLHQKWTPEEFNKSIGEEAKARESTIEGGQPWLDLQKFRSEAREAEKRKRQEERFNELMKEEEPTPDESGEEDVRETVSEQRKREHMGLLSETEDPDARTPVDRGEEYEKEGAHLIGPGAAELGLLRTETRQLVRGPMSSREAAGILTLFNRYNKHITDVSDIYGVLKRIQERSKMIGWFTGKRFGIRGSDLTALSGLSKMVRWWYGRLLGDAGIRNELKAAIKKKEVTREEAYNQLKDEAAGMALFDLYETIQKHRTGKESVSKGESLYNDDAFTTETLERYGDTTQQDVRRAAISAERVLAEAWADIRSKGQLRELATPGREEPIPTHKEFGQFGPRSTQPEMLGGIDQMIVRQQAQERYGTVRPLTKFPPSVQGVGEYQATKGLPGELMRQATELGARGEEHKRWGYERQPFKPVGFPGEAKTPFSEGAPGLTLKQYGPSRRAQEEMVAQGRALPMEREPETMSNEELFKEGEIMFQQGHDPEEAMVRAAITGKFDWRDVSLVRYWGRLLYQAADGAAKDYGAGSAQYDLAKRDARDWMERMQRVFAKMASREMKTLQGNEHIDLGSYTAVRTQMEDIKGRELTEEELDEVKSITEDVDHYSKLTTMQVGDVDKAITDAANEAQKLDPGQQKAVDKAKSVMQTILDNAKSEYNKKFKKGAGMSVRGEGGEVPPLEGDEMRLAQAIGGVKLMELSIEGNLSEASWREAMIKEYPELINHLDQVHELAQRFREQFIQHQIGESPAMANARERFRQKRPPVEESVAIIRRAAEIDPKGKHISTSEAYHTWNFIKQTFLDPIPEGMPRPTFQEILWRGAEMLGTPEERLDIHKMIGKQQRLYRALATNRTVRRTTKEMYDALINQTRVTTQAKNWLKNQQFPGWVQFVRKIPRFFFVDKIIGHGAVGLVTHASNMIANPYAWKSYFPAWKEMYNMVFSGQYHQQAMYALEQHPNYQMWKQADLQIDPFQYTDDYKVTDISQWFSKTFRGRGFDALKTLRLARAEQWWNSLPEHLKTKEMSKLIAQSVNHATGIITPVRQLPEAANWIMFAPKLEMSRWAFLFKDSIKAADYLARWAGGSKDVTPEQKAWAMAEVKQKASQVGMYFTLLAMNQGFLKAIGSDEEINAPLIGSDWDPGKADFMAFKVPGFRIGVMGPMVGVYRVLANLAHISMGEQSKFEQLKGGRQERALTAMAQYARSKASPIASLGLDVATQQDFRGRTMPWSDDPIPRYRQLQGVTQYSTPEWAMTTFLPIPFEEAVREVWRGMDMDEKTMTIAMKSLVIAGAMAATGARVSEEPDR